MTMYDLYNEKCIIRMVIVGSILRLTFEIVRVIMFTFSWIEIHRISIPDIIIIVQTNKCNKIVIVVKKNVNYINVTVNVTHINMFRTCLQEGMKIS